MEFRVLGPLQLVADGHELELTSVQRRRLLAVLVARAGQVVPVEGLVNALWGEDPPVSARQSLQSHVSRLRGTLATVIGDRERVVTRGAGYVLVLDETDEIDAVVFEREIGRARAVAGQDPAQALDLLEAALVRWRGLPYAEVASAVEGEVARLERLHRSARDLRIDVMMAVGQFEAAIGGLEARCRQQPLDEPVVGRLMLALARSGRLSEALECYCVEPSRAGRQGGSDVGRRQRRRRPWTVILRRPPERGRNHQRASRVRRRSRTDRSRGAEIHIVIRSHGPKVEAHMPARLETFGAGCKTDVTPKMPKDVAECAKLQFAGSSRPTGAALEIGATPVTSPPTWPRRSSVGVAGPAIRPAAATPVRSIAPSPSETP